MANISQNVNIEMLEKLPDGTYKRKYPKTRSDTGVTFDEHLADGTSHAKTARFVIGTSTAGWTSADCDYLCDGVDDQVEIQQAIDDLPANGGEIIILDGVYKSEGITIDSRQNITLRGNGDATKLETREKVNCLFIKDSSNININNLKIEDTTSSKHYKRNGIKVSNSKAARIDKVTVSEFFRGIEVLSESENICIENSTIYAGERECIYVENTYQCRVDNCLLDKTSGIDRDAILFTSGCNDIFFTNNYIDSLYSGIETEANRVIIKGNIVKAVSRTIYLHGSNRNIIVDNVLTGGEVVHLEDTLTTIANNNYQE